MPIIKITDIINNNYRLSPSNYINIKMKKTNMKELKYFVHKIDKGLEVGSQNYVENSKYHFLRTSIFDKNLFSLKIDNNTFKNINPNVFISYSLKAGDILICKDSNIGEVAILDQDYPNTMFSAGINRINFKSNSKYLYAVMKNENFKRQLESLIPKGSTLRHAKDLYLKCKIPEVTNIEVLKYIENIVDIIIHKELQIKEKKQIIDDYIINEINDNQTSSSFIYDFPTIKELKEINRLDTGNYTSEFKEINFKIKNYKYGFYTILPQNITGGNTPKSRHIKDNTSLKYLWITPTYINDDGTLLNDYSINCDKNNIHQNCTLIINRTSKGGQGEYVGISSYYDYTKFGEAQHNQGLYKVFGYNDTDLIFFTCMMNSPYYRKYCANLSMGSKMKELKLKNISEIPFPIFDTAKKEHIHNLYYNKLSKAKLLTKADFFKSNYEWDNSAGLLDVYFSLKNAKEHLNNIIDSLYNGNKFELKYKIY